MHRAHNICSLVIYLYLVSQWNVLFRVVGFVILILIQKVLNQFNNDVLADEFNHFSCERGRNGRRDALHAWKTQ